MRGAASVMLACALLAPRAATADQLSADDLARKNQGGYVTGLPLVSYSTDIGLGYGARAYYYYNGSKDDPRFATTPYLYRIFLQGFNSTGGTQFHWLDFDAPKIAGSPYRIRSQLIFERNTAQPYFGLGDASLAKLHFPGSAQQYSTFSAYNADEQTVTGGQTYARYDQYDLLRPLFIVSGERLFLGDHLRALAGLGFSWARVHDYTGKTVDTTAPAGHAIEAPTHLAVDCASGVVVGCSGGRDDYLRLGLSYDTRDFEPDPNVGVYLDTELDLATVALGSQYDYARYQITARGYWSPFPRRADLVLAARGLFEVQTKGAPFFSMDTIPFTEDPRTGLGGERTLRGFKQDRFVGSVMTLANAEIRWTFAHARIKRQRFAFIAVPFFDVGRPYDHLSELTVRDWRPSYGGSFRISWNLSTIITVDYGVSAEDTGFYVNFNHMF